MKRQINAIAGRLSLPTAAAPRAGNPGSRHGNRPARKGLTRRREGAKGFGGNAAGVNVAFIQSGGDAGQLLSTTMTGLIPGVVYQVSFRANARAATLPPSTSWSLNGGAFVPFTASPAVGGTNPYYTITGSFTATGPTAPLSIRNQTVADTSVLIDDFRIVAQ